MPENLVRQSKSESPAPGHLPEMVLCPAPYEIPVTRYHTTLVTTQKKVLCANEVPRGPEGLLNKLPFFNILP